MDIRTFGVFALLASTQVACGGSPPIEYPTTKRIDVVETHFGKTITDPYRWLEGDSGQDQAVAGWVTEQRRTTSAYLDALPARDVFRRSLVLANNYARLTAPQKEGGRYFYTRRDGGQDLAALLVREANGRNRVLVDPARWSKDGSVALAEWRASHDGRLLAYGVQDGGSDWRTIKVMDVCTGRILTDEVKWARFTQIAWARDGSGFYYSRYPEPKGGATDGASLSNHAVYFHRVGTAQAQDQLFYATPERPERLNSVGMTSDGRYAVAYSSADLAHAEITVVDLEGRDRTPRKLIVDPTDRWSVVGNVGARLYLLTDKNAERSKIVSIDLSSSEPKFADVIPQQDAIMTAANIVGDRLVVSYLVDAKSEVRRYTFDGSPDGAVRLPGLGSVSALTGEVGDAEAFFVFASFNQPNTVYRYDASKNTKSVWSEPGLKADLDQIVVEQVFYASKDGTRVPMFIARRKDITGPAPTVMMSYGAFGLSTPPAYSAMLTGWLLQGGALAMPVIRGGGEYGAQWHEAGRRGRKQNGLDDFIAAAEYLHTTKTAPSGGITAYGASAGGLFVGAVINQRPDLFGAALPAVGVMDMMRYDKFTGGRLWISEYGDPAQAADFHNLLSYSPYHNVRAGRSYPAILITTAESDNRVVPAHSFKYAAVLQNTALGDKPRLLRVDSRAGHGVGKPITQQIEEAADMWAFAAHWTGLKAEKAR